MILPRFSWVLDVSVIVYCGGAVISYMTNIGNVLAKGVYSIVQWNFGYGYPRRVVGCSRAALLPETAGIHKARSHFRTVLHFLHCRHDSLLLSLHRRQS